MAKKRHHPSRQQSRSGAVELLLAEDVDSLGKQGDIVQVKGGYARNYLVPQGLATVATDENKRMVERHRERMAQLQKDRVKNIRSLASKLSNYNATIDANTNADGHLYGSITAPDISKALRAAGFEISPDQVRLEGPLKELGMYTVKIHLHAEVQTEVKVWVVPASTN